MNFIKLKDDFFNYCDNEYTQNRYISSDKTVFITYDSESYIRVYTGKDDGTCRRISLKDGDSGSYPLYSVEQVDKLLKEYKGELQTINIDDSHYNKKRKVF